MKTSLKLYISHTSQVTNAFALFFTFRHLITATVKLHKKYTTVCLYDFYVATKIDTTGIYPKNYLLTAEQFGK